jgi:hypothetical protein
VPQRKRRVPKDAKSKIPKKYLSGVKGGDRVRLASVIKRIAKLYKEGKRIPQALVNERVKLGTSRRNKSRKR